VDVFNVLNSSDYFAVRTTVFTPGLPAGTIPAYLAPSSILQGRLVRIGANVNW